MRTVLVILVAALLSAAQQSKVGALLPDAASFGGKPVSAAAFYGRDLYRYLDGGAEAYHRRGFVALAHREYKARDVDLTVDIYAMGNAARAREMYDAERSPESRTFKLGDDACAGDGFLNFVQGRYYVKLIAFSEKSKPAAVLEAAARNISGKIHG